MTYFRKTQFFAVLITFFGAAYGQSVVINGGNIRVDVASSARAAVTVVDNSGGGASVGKVFVNSDFAGKDLSRGNYAGASFTNVVAAGANFRRVDLSRVNMTNVDLSNADFREANLNGAQMTNVDWDGALLEGAIWVDGRRCAPMSVGHCR